VGLAMTISYSKEQEKTGAGYGRNYQHRLRCVVNH